MTLLSWLPALAVLPATAVIIELIARWWLRHRTRYYVLPPGLRLRLQPDPEIFPELERVVRFEVNGDGERGADVPGAGPGLCRMLVVGGSQPEGYLLDQETAWPGALQRILEAPEHLRRLEAERVHVGNIARSGVGSEALDLILDRVLPRYPRLQTIVILVGASDVLRWLEAGAPPSAPPPVRIEDLFRCHPEMRCGWRPGSLAIVELLRRLRMRWLRPLEEHSRACRWLARARAMRAHATEVLPMPDPAPMLAHFDRHFRRALGRACAHADRVIVVRQPWFAPPYTPEDEAHMWHGGAGRSWQEEVRTFYSLEVVARLMMLLDAKASRIARDMDVEQIDLMPLLDRGLEVFYDTFHATPAGSRIIAAAVAATILRHPLQQIGADTGIHGAVEHPAAIHEKVS
jgi:lysophospholipase L1-like esterase